MPKEYIEREAVLEKLHEVGGCDADTGTWAAGYDAAIDLAINILKKAPAADVVEVVRGRWIETNWAEYDGHGEVVTYYDVKALKCSKCCHCFKKELLWRKNYCPHCGAKMNGKEQGNE